jgi:GR25 family glycosyltransferase involved in LPS biosynthesis
MPVITLVVDTLTQVALSFSIRKTPEQKIYNNQIHHKKTLLTPSFSNGSAYNFSGARDYHIDDAPELRSASLARTFTELIAQPLLTLRKPVNGVVEGYFTQVDIIVTPPRSLWRQAHRSPKNQPFGEAWRHGGGHPPRD